MIYLYIKCYRLTRNAEYASIQDVKLLNLFKRTKKRRKTLDDYQREMLVRQGRQQFQKLVEKGLGIPIGLL